MVLLLALAALAGASALAVQSTLLLTAAWSVTPIGALAVALVVSRSVCRAGMGAVVGLGAATFDPPHAIGRSASVGALARLAVSGAGLDVMRPMLLSVGGATHGLSIVATLLGAICLSLASDHADMIGAALFRPTAE